MRKLFIILAMFISASLMFASCKSSAEENSVPAHESSAPSEESSAEEAADTVLLGDVAQIDASGIYFVTVSYHNIEGRKSYRLFGAEAEEFAARLAAVQLAPFEKMRFDAITGGNTVYTVVFRGGRAEIVYDGSYTITADCFEKEKVNGECFLPASSFDGSVPDDALRCTLKLSALPEVLTFGEPDCGEYSANIENLWEKEIVLGSAEVLEQWQSSVTDYNGIAKLVVIDCSFGVEGVKSELSDEERLDLLESISLLSPEVMEKNENPRTGGSSFVALAFDGSGNEIWAAVTGDMGFMVAFPDANKFYRYECVRSFAPPHVEPVYE